MDFIHGVDEQLTRTPNEVHYSSKHTWTPNGVHLLLIWRDLAPDVTSCDMAMRIIFKFNWKIQFPFHGTEYLFPLEVWNSSADVFCTRHLPECFGNLFILLYCIVFIYIFLSPNAIILFSFNSYWEGPSSKGPSQR